ncbi:MAG: VanZ family protein, partial [Sedimentisphaerales bacterium]|nr:VanZ family protein [Sedimentisphaerales bacterium]
MKWWPRSWRIQLLLVIYWPILFVSTHIPNLNLSDVHIHTTDMFLHGLAFWLLTLLYWLTFHGRLRPSLRRRPLYFCLLILGIYAALDEISQKFVHRSAGWSDWAADLIGILTALVMLYLFRRAFYWLIVCWLAFFILKHRG